MTDIVVRYERPWSAWPWRVRHGEEGGHDWATFQEARSYAKRLNGGRLPRVNSARYGYMFPDRVQVCSGLRGRHFVYRGWGAAGDLDGYPTHTAAMTAAHELAKGATR